MMKPMQLDAVKSMSHTVLTFKVIRVREMTFRMSIAKLLIALAARVIGCDFVITHEWPTGQDEPQRRPPPNIRPDPETMGLR